MASDAVASFPTNVEEFGADERISFSLQSKTYIAVHDDGSEYEFNEAQRIWVPIDYDDEDGDILPTTGDGGAYDLDAQSKKRKSGPSYDDEVSCARQPRAAVPIRTTLFSPAERESRCST